MNNRLNLQTIRERDVNVDVGSGSGSDSDNDVGSCSTTTDTDDDCYKKNGNRGVRVLSSSAFQQHQASQQQQQQHCQQQQQGGDSSSSAAAIFDATIQQEQYTMMIRMTLELVRDMTIVKKHDEVLTAYGMTGRLLTRQGRNGSMEIQLPFGGTGTGAMLYHREPEMVHKKLSNHDYEQAMEHLEQIRKLLFTMHCQQWNIPILDEVCVPCLFDKPSCQKVHKNNKINSNNNNSNMNTTTSSMHTTTTTIKQEGTSSGSSTTTSTENKIPHQGTLIQKHTTAVAKKKKKRSWFSRQSSSSSSSSTIPVALLEKDETNGTLKKKKKQTRMKFCDVCGNPVCSKHIIPSEGHQQFRMCADCQFEFTQMFDTTSAHKCTISSNSNSSSSTTPTNLLDLDHLPHLTHTLERLVHYYTRMIVQLTFCVPNIRELADRLTSKERSNSKIALGTGTMSFVGAALGVAGAAALLTPAGPALLLAAVATSASSAALQGGHLGYNAVFDLNQKEVHQLADRILGWHGLCLGILEALEHLRQTLLQQIVATITRATTTTVTPTPTAEKEEEEKATTVGTGTTGTGYGKGKGTSTAAAAAANSKQQQQQQQQVQQEQNALLLQQVLNSRSHNPRFTNKSTSEQYSMEILNTLALGSYHTTRHGLTGVGLTASMGASYSQMINASIQTIPVVGAAFSVGCMAMDASNIASTLQKLQQPSSKAVALRQVEESFPVHIPATIQYEVEALLGAIHQLQEQQEEAQRTQQQELIEKELEELQI